MPAARETHIPLLTKREPRADKIRGFHLDMKGPMYTVDYLHRIIDRLAELQFNTILYEVEDKLQFERRPPVAHAEALSKTETRNLVDYAGWRGIEFIPLVQTMGHLEYALKHDEYAPLREYAPNAYQICPLKDGATQLVLDLIDDVFDATGPVRYFHLGGDETGLLGKCRRCAAKVRQSSKSKLYIDHMQAICDHVVERGARPILWCDMILAHPEALEALSRDVVIMDWDYWTGEERTDYVHAWGRGRFSHRDLRKLDKGFRAQYEGYYADAATRDDHRFVPFFYTDFLTAQGFEVINAPATRCHGDSVCSPKNSVHIPNVMGAVKRGLKDDALGTVTTCWVVRMNHLETNWYGIAAAAYAASAGARATEAALAKRYTQYMHGIEDASLVEAFHLLDLPVPYSESNWLCAAESLLGRGRVQAARDIRVARVKGALKSTIKFVEGRREEIEQAAGMIRAVSAKTAAGRDNLEHWLLAADTMLFYSDSYLCLAKAGRAKRGTNLPRQLLEKATELRVRTRHAFADTFEPFSLEEDANRRFVAVEAALRRYV